VAEALGVDVGGTFTDFFAFGPEGIRTWKRLSTPSAPEAAVLAGLEGRAFERVVHGSTVATNALLERRGPRTVLVTTEGFKDLLEIRRQERPRLYDLEPQRAAHVVRRGDVVPVRERLSHMGEALIPLSDEEVRRVVAAVRTLGAESVAVCLLFSYRNPGHEQRLAGALRAAGFEVSASHEVLPEHREYERASTTAINAFLRPTVRRYVERLGEALPGLRIMHSAGGTAAPAEVAARPVSMVTSGPAGGVLGALAVARAAGIGNIVTLDMGGTSTDVSLCMGEPRFRSAAEVDGLAVHTPLIDLVTVGAGGGSIGRMDAGGALVVGPESAGADPGPACCGRGTAPTVSDANLVLGRMRAERFLGGQMKLDQGRAAAALRRLADPVAAAQGMVRVVNANMARALRAVSLERGFDPAEFALVAFGGAGPIHACELAEQLGMPRVLVPRYPGVLSALGMVTAAEVVERSVGLLLTVGEGSAEALGMASEKLEEVARRDFRESGHDLAGASLTWAVDARYAGQAHELRVDIESPMPGEIERAFHEAHERQYGYSLPGRPVEVVTLRARLMAPEPLLPLVRSPGRAARSPAPRATSKMWTEAGSAATAPVFERAGLGAGVRFAGPALITQDDATTVVPAGWAAEVDEFLNLLLERQG
jgi:N-methylhydantoinase A